MYQWQTDIQTNRINIKTNKCLKYGFEHDIFLKSCIYTIRELLKNIKGQSFTFLSLWRHILIMREKYRRKRFMIIFIRKNVSYNDV